MTRDIHIVKVNCPGGIVSSGDLLSVVEAAMAAGVRYLRVGGRQQLLMEAGGDVLAQLATGLDHAGLPYEVDKDEYPNIVSASVADQIVYTGGWLREGVYKDILDSFDYRPRLSVNLVDQGQSFVPMNTGRLNFIASGVGNYWHLRLRLSPDGKLHDWKSLVYSGNIPRLALRLEGYPGIARPHDEAGGLDRIYADIMQSEQWTEQPPLEQPACPEFALPYYEGFNRNRDRLWLGIYRRDELFTAAFLRDLCTLCLQTKVARLHTTPWKSLVIPGIAPGDRRRWDIVLGRHGVNVRHALSELSWQVEDMSDEGLSLKHYLVRQFDRDDVRTFGLCFAIQLKPGPPLFGLVLIRKQPSGKKNDGPQKMPAAYEILYKKGFDASSDEYVLFRRDVQKDQLGPYLKSLCKYFYECKSGEDEVLHHVYRQKERGRQDSSETDGMTGDLPPGGLQQCVHCLTVYDPSVGDPGADILPGTPFGSLDNYTCPVCGSGKAAFVAAGSPQIEYFRFEEAFVERDMPCIPMVVRFNLDAAGIKLKLSSWSRFDPGERMELATRKCATRAQASAYKRYLTSLIREKTGEEAATIEVDEQPLWRMAGQVPSLLSEKAKEFGWVISAGEWERLTDLQRFALLKLCSPGHENKNFPIAMKEFGLAAT